MASHANCSAGPLDQSGCSLLKVMIEADGVGETGLFSVHTQVRQVPFC
jgi:hypothetical protein